MSILSNIGRSLRSTNPKRQSNTHDEAKSERRFNDAVEAAQRYYDLAFARAKEGDSAYDAWDALGIAQFWIGVAQTQLDYVANEPRQYDHFHSLVSDRQDWAHRLLRVMS